MRRRNLHTIGLGLENLSGVLVLGIPLEEILFALGFWFFWSGCFDLYAWRHVELEGFAKTLQVG